VTGQPGNLTGQYGLPDHVLVRTQTHQTYQERTVNLDAEVCALLRLSGDERILDAGCGPGLFLRYLRQQGHRGELIGIDQSAGMAAAAHSEALLIQAVAGDVTRMPFRDDEFDIVSARHMLYHVTEISTALSEINRVAKSIVLIATGSDTSMPFLMNMLAGVVTAFGMTPAEPDMKRFCTGNASQWLSTAGLGFREHLIENALVFRKVSPVVDYILNCLPSYGIHRGDDLYSDMSDWLTLHVEEQLATLHGVIRDPTRVGLYVVEKK
jgi:ubiquinone/menaquinone biosynthesis C-methylase UbiE